VTELERRYTEALRHALPIGSTEKLDAIIEDFAAALTLLASTEDTQWRPEIRDWLKDHGIEITHGRIEDDDE
jgi:hypothetical protein